MLSPNIPVLKIHSTHTPFFEAMSEVTSNNVDDFYVVYECSFKDATGHSILFEVRQFPYVRMSKAMTFFSRRVQHLYTRCNSMRPPYDVVLKLCRKGFVLPLAYLFDVSIYCE